MSATMPEKILKIAHRFMLNPVKILVRNDQLTLDGIRQFFVKVDSTADKASTLADLYPLIEKARGMIFCNCRNTVNEVVKRMNELGCPLQCIVWFFK
jgi:superfamily II DNA/RNA helicase